MSEEIKKPQAPLRMPDAIWETLFKRGYRTEAEVKNLFAPQLRNLTPPYELHDMDKAVTRLVSAHQNNEQVAIYADFDLDGTPGLALLKSALDSFGFKETMYYQPRRLSDGYGVHAHALESLKEQGADLVITVDVGITDVESITRANEIGLDVIVTDHHLAKEVLPPALAIVNPNKAQCESELGHLAGTGVAFYLALAVKIGLEKVGVNLDHFDPKSLLDCFAIGTITDMVPLTGENRVLVKHGLVQLESTERPGLQALLHALDLKDRRLTSTDISFQVAPKLNALSRLEGDILPIDLFLAEDQNEAFYLVQSTLRTNERRVDLQKEALEMAIEQYEADPSANFIWVWSRNFHQGVIGLVATKLAKKYGLPAFVGCEKESGEIVGSSRIPKDGEFNLVEILEACKEQLVKHGGHAPAAGFELEAKNATAFREALKKHFEDNKSEGSVVPEDGRLAYDAELKIEDLTSEFMQWHQGLEPYGVGFESPVFKIKNARIAEVRELRGGHFKLELTPIGKPYQRVSALWFNVPETEPKHPSKLNEDDPVELLAEPQWNYYKGNKRLQLMIKALV